VTIHVCHAHGCRVEVAPISFMCPAHWHMLPVAVRAEVCAVYVLGQEVRKDPSDRYLAVTFAAIRWLRAEEKRLADLGVQGTLDLGVQGTLEV
jgi:hypothetical protein